MSDLLLILPEGKTVKNRVHLDWAPHERSRDDEVARAVALGATVHEDHRGPEGRGWVTLRDPEGNEFCVEAGPHDRTGPHEGEG